MLLRLREYHRPQDLQEALRLLRRPDVRTVPLAGGTHLLGRKDREIEAVVDLAGLGLDGIREERGEFRIGAMVTLQQLVESPAVQGLAGGLLSKAARAAATWLLRHATTVGGRVAVAFSADDLLVALLALDARVRFWTDGAAEVPLADFLQGPLDQVRRGGLIEEVRFPDPGRQAGAAHVRVARLPSDTAIVNAVALLTLEDGRCRRVHLALGGVAPFCIRAKSVEDALQGKMLSSGLIVEATAPLADGLNPPGDFRASAEYRRKMATILARRALTEALLSNPVVSRGT